MKNIFYILLVLLASCKGQGNKIPTDSTGENEIANEEQYDDSDKDDDSSGLDNWTGKISECLNLPIFENYEVLDSAIGDANNDGLVDKVIVLKEPIENNDERYNEESDKRIYIARPLIFFMGQNDGLFKIKLINDSIIPCKICGMIVFRFRIVQFLLFPVIFIPVIFKL